MRTLLFAIALLVLATMLDNSLFDGRYTQAFSQMVFEIAAHFR